MHQHDSYINGIWAPATGALKTSVIDSFTEETFATYQTSSAADVYAAVRSARRALEGWSETPLAERIAAVRRVAAALHEQADALGRVISREVGMPVKLASRIQVAAPIAAWDRYASLAADLSWEEQIGNSLVQQVPVGVVACITPWNYPLHQITGKIAPALLAGCTVVLKPSEMAPSSAFMLAKAIEQAGLPAGVFNLVHGTGAEVGEVLVRHPEVDMISFTGSTQAGRRIASLAGEDVKRVALELGGKSAALVLPDADLVAAVKATLASCFLNSGQTCSATTRLLIPRNCAEAVATLVVDMVSGYRMGDPHDAGTRLGPLISRVQQMKVFALIDAAVKGGARRLTGGSVLLPVTGFFVPPTVLDGVTPEMNIAREEVFGPVLVVMTYEDIEEGIALANGTDYGLAATVWGETPQAALTVARRLRAGQVDVNGAPFNPVAPFGGFGKSGIGRENGCYGIEEFLEPVSIQLPLSYFEITQV